jgi:hypothetical protein
MHIGDTRSWLTQEVPNGQRDRPGKTQHPSQRDRLWARYRRIEFVIISVKLPLSNVTFEF